MSQYKKYGTDNNKERACFKHKRNILRLYNEYGDDEYGKKKNYIIEEETYINNWQMVEHKVCYGIADRFCGINTSSVIHEQADNQDHYAPNR